MREREVKALHRESKIVETLMLVTPSARAKQIYRMALSLMRQELEQQAISETHAMIRETANAREANHASDS